MATVLKIRPDIEIMPKEDYEEPELKIAISDERHKYCPHDHIKLFEHHRMVTCSDCGATLDPFNHLLRVGRLENNALSELTYLKHEIKWRTEDRDKLKAQISKLRSQLKKLA